MDTETKLICSIEQAEKFAQDILAAIEKAKNFHEAQYVHSVFEQMTAKGPWRLVLGIIHEDF